MAAAAPIYGPGAEEPYPLRPVPDLAGVEVVDVEGRHAGTVYGALADANSGLIRYLDVALAESDRHVLVPLGHTHVRKNGRTEVELRAATRRNLRQIPPYEPDRQEIDGAYQRRVLASHGRLFRGERYYAHPAYDHSGLYAGEHPIIRKTGENEPISLLRRLSEAEDYQVAAGESDIRGWLLIDANDRETGVVEDLLFDPNAESVRYVLIRPEEEASLIPVPVGFLTIDESAESVYAPALTRADLQALPRYFPGHFDRESEERVLQTIAERQNGERHYDRADFAAR